MKNLVLRFVIVSLMLTGALEANALSASLSGELNFGKVTLGKTATSTLTLKNTSKDMIRLDSFWFTGPYEFKKTAGTCAFNEWKLNAGKTCTVQIQFTPTRSGSIGTSFTLGYFLGKKWDWEEVTVAMVGEGYSMVVTPPPTPEPEPAPGPSPTGWLQVVGNKILNSNGQQVILKGVSIADPEHLNTKPWERPGVTARSVASLATDKYNAKVVRLPILPGDPAYPQEGFFSATNGGEKYFKNHVEPVVKELTAKGIYVIIDLHYISNYDGLYDKVAAFWKFMAPKFATNPYVLYEIFNEPIYPDNWATWKNTIAQPITDLIRQLAPNNLILVGGPYWSSHISGAAGNPVKGNNVVYVAHIYSNQSVDTWEMRYGAVADKYPLFISEWGFEAGGTEGGNITYGTNIEAWMRSRGLSWTAWCFDINWGPRMFNSDWSLRTGPGGMGEFVRDLLAK